ncbi:MAG: sigma 54-interacting transcriptional regulator [Planctomycetes bacterium]|nr:sigma 54-interacting transcriptional regulator [Planctomycetota bacterium]
MPKTKTNLIGRSAAFRKALQEASLAATQDAPVLIYGETGSGKGVLASHIHRRSAREGRLVSLNCATFQSNLFESELFGHMKGAFTGAVKDTPGLFEAAEGGTLFLDEIGDTPVEIQPKLLRALEEGVVRRVGGTREIPVDVRLICATNQDLKQLIAEGKFREDLYYRINSFVVTLPPLRDRVDDIEELATSFLGEHFESDLNAPSLSIEAADALKRYPWPGNIRELRSAMAYAVAQAGERTTILLEDLPESVQADEQQLATVKTDGGHIEVFRELYRRGAEDAQLWAKFLLTLNEHLGSNKFARGDMLDCLRAVRGADPTNNSLVNEWQRHIKPVPLRLNLIREEGKKLRIDLDACRRALIDSPLDESEVDEGPEPITETAVEPQPSLSERRTRTNLDSPRTTFIGRKAEHQKLVEVLLNGQPNVITLTGPGGTGKTRLSREVGRSLTGSFKGGVWFADLTESRNIEGVAYAVAQALGAPLTGNQAPELAVRAMLSSRPPCLLILDNFEQVAEVASAVVGDWVRGAPNVQFLITSRALLGIEGEQEFELKPLPLPDGNSTLSEIQRSEAVRLFVDRARVHHVGFELDEKSGPAVAQICARLEGMPLAIELAAARTVIMRPEQIAARLDRIFDVLKSSRRDLAPRQRSLHATIDWSYDLLSEPERWAFAQLSVFRGGFFLDSAETVLDLSRFSEAPAAMDLLQSLREKSLLRATETPHETRFGMYQVIREYAAERWLELASDTERESVNARFAEYFRRYAAEWDRRIHTQDALEALDRLDYARSNLQEVLQWAQAGISDPDKQKIFVDISLHMYSLLRVRGPARQRVPALDAVLDMVRDEDPAMRARLLFLQSQSHREAGDPAEGYKLAVEAVTLAKTTADENLIATAKFNLAGVEYAQGQTGKAQALHREVLEVFRATGNRANEARVLSRMALLGTEIGDFSESLENSRKSEEIMRELGDLSGLGFVLSTRGNMYHRHAELEQAVTYFVEAEKIYRELNDKRMIAMCLGNLALLNRQLRRFDAAEPLVHECTELARELGDRLTLAKNLMNTGIMYVELGHFDRAEPVLKEGAPLFAEHNLPILQAVCIENLAFIAGQRGDLESALAGFNEAESLCDDAEDMTLVGIRTARAETLIMHGRNSEAAPLAVAAVDAWHNSSQPHGRDLFRALVAHARTTQDAKMAIQSAEEAMQLARQLHFSADDPSPSIQASLKFLSNFQKK